MTKPALSKAQSASPENPLDAISALLAKDLAAVNALILDRMQSSVPLIPELAGHLIASGGKRLRPLLTLASAALFGYKGARQHKLAACVEFIHTATLLHDDVVDDSVQRRGKSSANALFGNEAAVLVGDFLFSRSFQLMVEDGSLDVLRILSNAAAVIAEGEVLQLSAVGNLDMRHADYMAIIHAKTAELFAAACETGAVVAGASAEDCARLRTYGLNLGIAFQISDDVLDYALDGEKLGKDAGDDFREGKITLPALIALEKANDQERVFWRRCFVEGVQEAGDFARAQDILKRHGAQPAALAQAERFAEEGKHALKSLPVGPVKDLLVRLIDYAATREH